MNERIAIDSKICHGKPVIRGTRTPVTVILSALAGGDSFETLEREYSITADDIRVHGHQVGVSVGLAAAADRHHGAHARTETTPHRASQSRIDFAMPKTA